MARTTTRNLTESLHIKLNPQDLRAVQSIADKRELTTSDVVREALRVYLAQQAAA